MITTLESTLLYGMMGCGKSTLGEGLAAHLGQDFTDTDALIEAQMGMTCGQIIADPSSDFAAVQQAVILGYTPEKPLVIATGGSVAGNRILPKHLGTFGVGIFINVQPAILEARLPEERIKALFNPNKLSFAKLYESRMANYKRAANFMLSIEPGETIEESLARLIDLRTHAGRLVA